MTIGVHTLEFHLPMARSLKNKRQVMRRLKDRLRARYNVAVAELEQHAALWQRAGLTVVSVAATRERLVGLFESIHRDVETHPEVQVVASDSEFLDGQWSEGG